MHQGLLVIKRSKDRIWRNLPADIRKPLLNYRGYDGEDHWPHLNEWATENHISLPLRGQLAPVDHLNSVIRYARQLDQTGGVEILFLTDSSTPSPPQDYHSLGYDFGVLYEEEEPVFFSVLLNEVRSNGNHRLSPVQAILNEHYLLPDRPACSEVYARRKAAFASNMTEFIETAYTTEQCVATEIFAPKDHPPIRP